MTLCNSAEEAMTLLQWRRVRVSRAHDETRNQPIVLLNDIEYEQGPNPSNARKKRKKTKFDNLHWKGQETDDDDKHDPPSTKGH